ncbi:MAG: phosphonate metabolism protein/1,5-bisphosphokinase (PRPP-forming) PhnN [Roseitalea porphyridii]|uniref:phosphonate metabolism protein/1,5-bisphosphokinase (PRPP-forming) PhnN n=1 Tax=Roseitalea porphyridii TaxID=1852022 RepID=UPI0032EEE7F3
MTSASVDLAPEPTADCGRLIVVLGPSGSGKDTLMSQARRALEQHESVLFVRRAITRPADAGSEDHVSMSETEFDTALDAGEFSLTWSANGLRYGLPREMVDHLAKGKVAVVNGSRAVWETIRSVFPTAFAVEIRVDRDVLAQRLEARGRESRSEIAARLERAGALEHSFEADHVIDNSGSADVAGSELVSVIRSALQRAA